VTPRDHALTVLNRMDHAPGLLDGYLETSFQKDAGLDERDRAFGVHLVQGVLRWRVRLDWIIQQRVHFPFRKIAPSTLNILRLALYQIYFMDRVPDRAAVDEAVKQAGSRGSRHVAGFVNGMLRGICRDREGIRFPDPAPDADHYLSVTYSYPIWLVKKWVWEWGRDGAERLLDAGNRIPGRVIRVNTLRIDRDGLMMRLKDEGVSTNRCAYSPDGLRMEDYRGDIARLAAFKEGLYQVQGEAAQVCSHLLTSRQRDLVLDACAGLGGKSTHLAALMRNRGRVVALDRDPDRLLRPKESAGRLGAASVLPVSGDATGDLPLRTGSRFDNILVDAPCSGLGVISRHPDIKINKGPEDIERLARLQRRLLSQTVRFLKPGGRLLYTTCTISKEENDGVVEAFLRENRGMVLEDLEDVGPRWARDLIDSNGFFRTLPHVNGMEGFFGALFRKRDVQ